MDFGMNNSLLTGDPRINDHIVGEVKSQGIFDQFRKECIADVDTKPAYQNLRTRVESSVNNFLSKQKWRPDLNKNQLREQLRKHIHDAPYLENGVERIVDQVVNPKIYSVFMPQVEEVVCKFLGFEKPKPQRNGACDLKDLLPKDLDPVSPESDRNSLKDESFGSVDENVEEMVDGNEQELPNANAFDEKMQVNENSPIKSDIKDLQEESVDISPAPVASPVKVIMNSSFKSDDTNKTEEEEEESPDFEPIEAIHMNESNISNDSILSGISELTSHDRSQSPDFTTDFARDNFDCSNQDSQLSKVSSNSRLSIVTDFSSSNQASNSLSEPKEDSKGAKEEENKFNFQVVKNKDSSKMSSSSKESSRDASDCKGSKNKDDSKSKFSREKYEHRSSRDKNFDSKKRRSSRSDKYSRSKSKDKTESENSEKSNRNKEIQIKDIEKKEETSKEVKDLKDLYKEKIRELREKKELTEKEKLKDTKDKKESSTSKDREKSQRSSSSSKSGNLKSPKYSESKDKNSSKRDDRRHSNGKNEAKSSSRGKRESRSEKKRRDEKKSKSADDHSSLRKNFNDRRSSDRDGSNGPSSKYTYKSTHGNSDSSNKLNPSTNLNKKSNRDSRSENTDKVNDSLQMFGDRNSSLKKVDPGSSEISLPLKKRPLHNDESQEVEVKKIKIDDKKFTKRIEKDIFKMDTDVESVPDEERVQIIEIPDEEYDQPYSSGETILSLEETKKIILDGEPHMQSKLSEMEQSIRQSLNEMISDHRSNDTEEAIRSVILSPTMESTNTLLETLTEDSNTNLEDTTKTELKSKDESHEEVKFENKIEKNREAMEIGENIVGDTDTENEGSMTENSNIEVNTLDHCDESIENIEQYVEETSTNKNIVTENICGQNKECEDTGDLSGEGKLIIDEEIGVLEKHKESKESAVDDVHSIQTNSIVDNDEKYCKMKVNDSNKEWTMSVDWNKIEKSSQSDDYSDLENDSKNIGDQAEENREDKVTKEKAREDDKSIRDRENTDDVIIKDRFSKEKLQQDSNVIQCEATKVEKIERKSHQNTGNDNDSNVTWKDNNMMDITSESPEKLFEYAENIREEMKDRLIDELGKLNENDSDIEKPPEEEMIQEIMDEKRKSSFSNNIKMLDDGEIRKSIVVVQITDDDDKKRNDLEANVDDCIDEDDKHRLFIVDDEREEETKIEYQRIINKDSNIRSVTLEEPKIDPLFLDSKEETTKKIVPHKSSEIPTITRVLTSPIEEECRYFETDNHQRYLNFKKFLEKLEADSSRSLEDMIESYGGIVVSKQRTSAELSPSPVTEILEDNSNNSNGTENETTPDEVTEIENINEKIFSEDTKKIEDTEKIQRIKENEKSCEREDTIELKEIKDTEESEESNDIEELKEIKETEETKETKKIKGIKVIKDAKETTLAKIAKESKRVKKIKDTKEIKNAAEINETKDDTEAIEIIPEESVTAPMEEIIEEPTAKQIVTKTDIENPTIIIKKRKTGRQKKPSTAVSNPQPQEQQPPLPEQKPQFINGENFSMPPSPESDVSASSDKNTVGNLREERTRSRNRQRYSSDDLYKPRPLFSSSSRRNRRYPQA